MKICLTAFLSSICFLLFAQSEQKFDYKKLSFSFGVQNIFYRNLDTKEDAVLNPIDFLNAKDNDFKIIKEEYVLDNPYPFKARDLYGAGPSYYKKTGYEYLSCQFGFGYEIRDKVNLQVSALINTRVPTEPIQNREFEFAYSSGRLFFLDESQTDVFYTGNYNSAEAEDTFRLPKVKSMKVHNPSKSYGIGIGVEYRFLKSRNKHVEASLKTSVNVASSFHQKVRLEMYNNPSLPYNEIEAYGVDYDYLYPVNSSELFRRKDVVMDMPSIYTIGGQLDVNLMYRPILKLPVLLGANVGWGYGHSVRNGIVLVSKNNFNIGARLLYSWAY